MSISQLIAYAWVMSLGHAILAALLDGEASGYDLSKRFDASVANFWPATRQQLYRELDRLEADRLVRAKLVRQQERPDKRVFRLTAAGRKELHSFIAADPRPSKIRDELLVQVQAAEDSDTVHLVRSLEQRLQSAQDKLEFYERLREHLLNGRSEADYVRDADRVGPYLTLLRGMSFEQENADWCRRCIEVLRSRTKV